jgi:hypothetical protein
VIKEENYTKQRENEQQLEEKIEIRKLKALFLV